MEALNSEFKLEVADYISKVNQDNFENMYDGLVYIIYEFKNKGLSKNHVGDSILEIHNTNPDKYQQEILGEMLNRLYGNCPPFYLIEDW